MLHKLRDAFQGEHERLILWVPVCMGLGVAWYFHLRHEPPLWLGAALMLLFAAMATGFRRIGFLRYGCVALALVGAGVTLSQWRTHHIHSPALQAPLSYAQVSGRIVEIAPTPKGSKILLEAVRIDGLAPALTPKHVSLTLRSYDPELQTGQQVSLHAGLFPPPEPALPGGFDFSRYFFFRETGAVGYGIGGMEVKSLRDSGASGFAIGFAEFRHRLTEGVRAHFSEPSGAVAAAFITGETRTIPDAVNDDMRIAGLYHLLAVSGMNLSVVAGLAFFSFRFLLAAIPALALRYPIKKWAAVLALAASYVYLRVSGSPVSAERAFFMVSLVFLAILLDRDPNPMRSVALAAFCIICYEPEQALTASFQLSFSATAALIASYEWGVQRFARLSAEEHGIGMKRIALYFAAVMATALVAWLATEPFIIYNFNQFSSYSLLSNTIAEPLVSFILMPLVIAGVLLMPLHLGWLAFTPMQYGVQLLLGIADFVAHLPHAMLIVASPTDAGFTLAFLGGAWIYFWKTGQRWLGVPAVLLGMATALAYVPPDMFIGSDGKHVAVRLEDGRTAMIRGKATSVMAQSWARAATSLTLAERGDSPARCDRQGCALTVKSQGIAVLRDRDAVQEECHLSRIIVTDQFVSAPCPGVILIDKATLDKTGATTLWLTSKDPVMRSVRMEQGDRPWVNHPFSKGED